MTRAFIKLGSDVHVVFQTAPECEPPRIFHLLLVFVPFAVVPIVCVRPMLLAVLCAIRFSPNLLRVRPVVADKVGFEPYSTVSSEHQNAHVVGCTLTSFVVS
jgi:hypothetical protein